MFSRFNSLVLRSLLLQKARDAQTCERNNVVKREALRPAKSRQIRIEIDLITSASWRDAVFTSMPSWTRAGQRDQRVRANERRSYEFAWVRIESFDYNVEIRCRGEEDAWFHLPVANRNHNPVQTATIDIYYVDRGEPNWPRTRPPRALKSKRNQSYPVHSTSRFPSSILFDKYFALTTILLYLSPGLNFIFDFIIFCSYCFVLSTDI